jgi:WD40 repeat protein
MIMYGFEKKLNLHFVHVPAYFEVYSFVFSKIWDAVSGEELHTFQHKHIVKCVDFSTDGNRLLSGSQEKILRIFDLENLDSGKNENLKLKYDAHPRVKIYYS